MKSKKLWASLATTMILSASLVSPVLVNATENEEGQTEQTTDNSGAGEVEDSSTPSTSTEPTEPTTPSTPPSTSDSKPAVTPPAAPKPAPVAPRPVAPAKGKKVPAVDPNQKVVYVKNQTTQEFIESIGEEAREIAWDNDLYASVMIAQAILETGSGNSALAQKPNFNLYGIKGSYEGASVSFNTSEDNGRGELYTIVASFRKYPSYKESLTDYADLLKKGISGSDSFYSGTWKSNTTDYKEATAFLTGKYATDILYDKKLNGLIETYELTKYDEPKEKKEEAKATTYKVQPGDTLSEIAVKCGTTVDSIVGKNSLTSTIIFVGQELTI